MDSIIQIVVEFVRPVGNACAKHVLPKGFVEEDSFASDALGGFLVLATLIVIGFLLARIIG